MKKNRLQPLLSILSNFIFVASISAQMHFTPTVSPMFNNSSMNNFQFSSGYAKTSMKHKFYILFKDGTGTVVKSKIQLDSPLYYIVVEDKSLSKSDSGRYKKVYPSQTKYISRVDDGSQPQYVGNSNDSCWLFKTISGTINAYTPLAEETVVDQLLTYVQKEGGPLIKLTQENMEDIVQDSMGALELAKEKKYTKAIIKYNKEFKSKTK